LNIPHRHDLSEGSVANKALKETDVTISKLCKQFRNVNLIDISDIDRHYHTRHGLHLNWAGKQFVSAEISKVVNIRDQLKADPLSLHYMDQGRSDWTWLQSVQPLTVKSKHNLE